MSPLSKAQTTLGEAFAAAGKGLHTGQTANVKVCPAPANTGYIFKRVDLPGSPEVPARLELVSATARGTVVTQGAASVATIEHLLGSLYGMGVDNALIEIDGPEVPILDGSGATWTQGIAKAGVVDLDAVRQYLDVNAEFSYEEGAKSLDAKPAQRLEVLYRIDYHHPALGQQELHLILDPGAFAESVAPARTFCFENEVQALRDAGLIKGGDLDCALVLGAQGVLNPPLRFPDEFVRHKTLDFLGDLALAGRRVRGAFVVERAGHAFHVQAMKALLARFGGESASSLGSAVVSDPSKPVLMDIEAIKKLLPHRPPILLVDRVTGLELMKNIVAEKDIRADEPVLAGHFPGHPIYPGVYIIEGMAQAGGLLVMKSLPETAGKLTYFMGIDNARFRRPVSPGDTLRYEVEAERMKGKVSRLKGKAYVGSELAAEADLMCMIVDEAKPKA